VLFVDDEAGRRMRPRVRGAVLGAAVSSSPDAARGADVVVERADRSPDGMRIQLATPVGRVELASPLVGDFNLANITLAAGMALGAGIGAAAIAAGISGLAGVPGRLQRIANRRGVLCVVDYAHTPDALERAIAALRPLVDRRAGRMLVVFGCGGDRDPTKRPLMGEVVARDADLAIATSDNPRTEDPAAILDMVVAGVRRQPIPELAAGELASASRGYHREVDRRAAIGLAVAASRAGDVLLIAGKGHEDYQILGTTKVHFDDREEAAAAFAAAPPPAAEAAP